jgi:hypothetical protein
MVLKDFHFIGLLMSTQVRLCSPADMEGAISITRAAAMKQHNTVFEIRFEFFRYALPEFMTSPLEQSAGIPIAVESSYYTSEAHLQGQAHVPAFLTNTTVRMSISESENRLQTSCKPNGTVQDDTR